MASHLVTLHFYFIGVIEIFIDLGLNSSNLYNTEFEAGAGC